MNGGFKLDYDKDLEYYSIEILVELRSIARHNINSFYQLIDWNHKKKSAHAIKEMKKYIAELHRIKYILHYKGV
jgi:hypothetical protein